MSSNASLIAAQIASVSTRIISSTYLRARRNVSFPTLFTATPSAKSPTCGRVTRRPAWSERDIASESNGCTPTTRTSGRSRFTYAPMPPMSPPFERFRMPIRLVVRVAHQHHLGATGSDGVDLDAGRGDGHDDCRAASQALRRERDALRVVAGGCRDHPALQRSVGERGHLVVSAAQLEGEDGLHVLPLEQEVVADPRGEGRRALQWSLDGHVVDTGSEDPLEVIPRPRHLMTCTA